MSVQGTILPIETNTPSYLKSVDQINGIWLILNSFLIMTMQTGFALLESGIVSRKNEVNLLAKNIADIVLGGLAYWIYGYSFQMGYGVGSNNFIGVGQFFLNPGFSDPLMGPLYVSFLFQLSFSATSTTIVGGAVAERINYKAYCLFAFLAKFIYAIPASWLWGANGFLMKLGAVDIAGSGVVHLTGGSSAFAAAALLGPRLGRYEHGLKAPPMGNPVNAGIGTFVLWWGWLAFNSGSTYDISGNNWAFAAKAAVMTMLASFGGGLVALVYSLIRTRGHCVDYLDQLNGILGGLVSITAGCFLYSSWESVIVGQIGGLLAITTPQLFDRMGIDDPVGAVAVHGVCGIWGLIAVGLFSGNPQPINTTQGQSGLFHGGGFTLLGVQLLAALCLMTWAILVTSLLLWLIKLVIPIRMDPNDELLGGDLTEHRMRHSGIQITRAISALEPAKIESEKLRNLPKIGLNPGHEKILNELYMVSKKLPIWKKVHDGVNPAEEVLRKRMKTDRDGILKRLRSRIRARVTRDPKTNQLVPVETIPAAAEDTEAATTAVPTQAWIN